MKTEVSAGGVVFRKTGSGWEVLLMKDMNGQWTFPKGIIEINEDRQTAARREITEEVGIQDLKFIIELSPIRYRFKRKRIIQKIVYYFVFTSIGNEPLIPQHSEGISDAAWHRKEDAIALIGYPDTNKPLLLQAYERISRETVPLTTTNV